MNLEPFVVDAPALPQDAAAPPSGPIARQAALAHLAAGFGEVLSHPRVLLFLVGTSILAALPAALAVYRSAVEHLAPVVAPDTGPALDLLGPIPRWLLQDWARRDPSLAGGVAAVLAPSLLAASWFGLLVCAGWMGLSREQPRRPGLASFLAAGGRQFFPFLRTWLLGLPLCMAATWLVWGGPGERLMVSLVADGDPELAASETVAHWIAGTREVLSVFLLLGVEILLDLARASLVAGRRRSALLALARGFGFFLFEPLRVWALVGAGFVFELLWLAGLSAAAASAWLPVWSLIVLLPLGRIVCRGARWVGLLRLYAEGRPARASTQAPAAGED